MLVTCRSCGANRDFSIFEKDVICPACGADGESLTPVSASSETVSLPDGPYRVLFAEDDEAMRESYRLWFDENPGWELQFAADGKEALAALDSTIDVLVLDRKMPKLSGPEVIDRLDTTTFDGKILVVSAYQQDDHLSEADVAGYITKPIHEETLFEMLEEILR